MTKEQLAKLLKEAEKAHAEYEKETGHKDENWPEWYAEYILSKFPPKADQPLAEEVNS